jgi:TetR/AcrR family transcriptional regulator
MQHPAKRSSPGTEVRQAALVEAALRLAAQQSPADVTTADLARAVGITQGAVFRHFASKEAIWLAALQWTTETLMARLHAAAGAAPGPLEALQAVFRTHVDFVVSHPGVPRVIFQELQHAQETAPKTLVRGLMLQYRTLLEGLLRSAKEQRLLAADVDLQAAAVLFIGSLQGLVMQSLISGQVHAMPAQAAGVFTIYLRGLTAAAWGDQP